MGAYNCEATITAKTADEAITKAKDLQEQQCHEYGHGAYTGHLGTAGIGVQLMKGEFPDEESAVNKILDLHDKWDLPMLARIKDTDKWVLAGWCSS